MRRLVSVLLSIGMLTVLISCGQQTPSIVVTTTMLERAVLEVIGSKDDLKVVRLIPAGNCPGHFDISPRMLPLLKSATLIIRHDYQEDLGERISALCEGRSDQIVVETKGSLLIPDNYADLVRGIATILSEKFPKGSAEYEQSVENAEARLRTLAGAMRERSRPFQGKPVIAAFHQLPFCRWLGLDVVGVLRPAGQVTPAELAKLRASGAEAVVGNLQSDAKPAEALAEQMGRPAVLFSNFPGASGYGEGYEELLSANMRRLEAAFGG